MEHKIPGSHLGLLQAILVELIKVADPDATFEVEQPETDSAEED